jgi:acyl dehydratase
MRYFEDFRPGDVLKTGSYVVPREEIIAFAQQFDPQSFHLDEDAARNSIFGGIIASGWHTASISHRLFVDGVLSTSYSTGSPGLDELRWLLPVRPGDELSMRAEVLSTTPSRSKPELGAIKLRLEVSNQKGEVVMTEVATVLFSRRPQASM